MCEEDRHCELQGIQYLSIEPDVQSANTSSCAPCLALVEMHHEPHASDEITGTEEHLECRYIDILATAVAQQITFYLRKNSMVSEVEQNRNR